MNIWIGKIEGRNRWGRIYWIKAFKSLKAAEAWVWVETILSRQHDDAEIKDWEIIGSIILED